MGATEKKNRFRISWRLTFFRVSLKKNSKKFSRRLLHTVGGIRHANTRLAHTGISRKKFAAAISSSESKLVAISETSYRIPKSDANRISIKKKINKKFGRFNTIAAFFCGSFPLPFFSRHPKANVAKFSCYIITDTQIIRYD